MKNAVQNETSRYALDFSEMTEFDMIASRLFKEFAEKTEDEVSKDEAQRDYFSMIRDFDKTIIELDSPFVWSKAINQQTETIQDSSEQPKLDTSLSEFKMTYNNSLDLESQVSEDTEPLKEKESLTNKCLALVCGECGQGKSTVLNEIVKLAKSQYYKKADYGCKFVSKQSVQAVTQCV